MAAEGKNTISFSAWYNIGSQVCVKMTTYDIWLNFITNTYGELHQGSND